MVALSKPLPIRIATTGGANFSCPWHGISYRASAADRKEGQPAGRNLKWLKPDLATRVRYPTACIFPQAIKHQCLADFIYANSEAILQAWEDVAVTIEPEISEQGITELRHHAQQILAALAAGLAVGGAGRKNPAADNHAAACIHSGLTVVHLISLYHALRRCVLTLWCATSRRTVNADAADLIRFNAAVDQAMSESVARYQLLADQSQNMFLAILGHDLRNPLGTLVAGANLMMNDSDLAPKNVMMATRMFSSARRMKKLIDDFIDFTRTHLGSGIPVKVAPANLVAVCWQVVNEIRTAYPKRFVDLRTPSKLEATFDADRIAQVLSNLIGNALQYGNELFPVRVFVSACDDAVEITVNNRGPIIPPDQIARIFDAMVRLAHETGAESAGRRSLGIGLYISREIVKAHRGQITVVSNAEQGTTFKVWMPRKGMLP